MGIYKAYKVELKPNNKQITFFNQCINASRYVYNWGLLEWKKEYENKENPSRYGLCVKFNSIKNDICPWIRNVPYAIIESSFVCLDLAFKNFFRNIKNGKKIGYPKFKKEGYLKSFKLRGTKIFSDKVKLRGIGYVKLKQENYIPINCKYGLYITISKKANKWFISVPTEESFNVVNLTDNIIGIDLGIKSLAVTSDNEYFDNPKAYSKYEKQLKKLQRELSRRKNQSKNFIKTKNKIAKIHARIENLRENTLHELTTKIIDKNPKVIVLEDLNVKVMTKNHNLAKFLIDSSFGELRKQFEYKAERKGIEIFLADQFEPSSKKCSNCGNIKEKLLLSERVYCCDKCGFEIDRDLNAAINLKNLYNSKELSNGQGLSGELT